MVLKEAKIGDDEELKALLIKDPNQIEENFKIITHRGKTSGLKRLAFLGVDSGGILTLIELKVTSDENQLRKALEYYDWLMEQGIDWIADAYKERLQGVTLKEHMPQIFLIAPDFDDKLVKEAKYLRADIKLRLFRYLAFEINGNREIKLMETPIPQAREIERKPKMSGKEEIKLTDMPIPIKTKPENIKELLGEELCKNLKITSGTPVGWEELEKEIEERLEKELYSKLKIMNDIQDIFQEERSGWRN